MTCISKNPFCGFRNIYIFNRSKPDAFIYFEGFIFVFQIQGKSKPQRVDD